MRLVAAAGIFLCVGTNAFAQSQDEMVKALSGSWFVFDPAHSTPAGPCQLDLSLSQSDVLQADPANCLHPLAGARSWSIDDNTLVLRDETGNVTIRLGGNQNRVTGEIEETGQGIILERATGDEFSRALAQSIQRHACIYRGTSAACADTAALSAPQISATEGTGQIRLLANLFVRSQPRRDSSPLGVLASGSCIVVNQCTIASDGTWCRANFGEETAWMAKSALRQGEWPVVTFVAGCAEGTLGGSGSDLEP